MLTALANNDEQRKALADFKALLNGASGYLQGNDQSFSQKAHGQHVALTTKSLAAASDQASAAAKPSTAAVE